MDGLVRFGAFELRASQRALLRDGAPVALGARAFDLLVALVAQRDRVVPKADLLDAVWPGVVVEENTLQVHVSALRKALGPSAIATVPGRGYRFTELLDGAAAERQDPGAEPRASREGNLPLALAPLYGRDKDVAALNAQLDEHRLVTVVGAGGIGKSRLALASAHARAQVEPPRSLPPEGAVSGFGRPGATDGPVWWIELSGLADPAQLAPTLARTLGLAPEDGRADESSVALATALVARRLLLVLDNCEHLVDGVAALVERLLRDAPGVRVLATSQEPLHIAEEVQFRLRPLAVPGTTALAVPGVAALAQARSFGGVALFEARATAADRRFVLDESNLAAVIEICSRLDGLPLAIELAAARVATLGVHGVRERLDSRFKLLTAGERTALRRHQTLAAALEWSHGLMEGGEQAVFRRLGVFAGGFTMRLAQAVCADVTDDAEGGGAIDGWAVLEHLSALVDKSLVVVDDDEPPRYRLLETARAFALERLADATETTALLERHARALLEFVADLDTRILAGRLRSDRADALLLPELDNLRAAWSWARRPGGDLAFAVALAGHAGPFASRTVEPGEWLLALADDVPAAALDDAVAARYKLAIANHMGDRMPSDVRLAAVLEAIRLYRPLGRPHELFRALTTLCWMVARTDLAAARAALDEARALAGGADRPAPFNVALLRRDALLAQFDGSPEAARALHRRSIAALAEIGDWYVELLARHAFVDWLWGSGAVEEAAREVDVIEALTQRRPVGVSETALHAANAVGVYLECGRLDDAWSVARRSFPALHRAAPVWADTFSGLLWRRGHGVLAAHTLGFAQAMRERLKHSSDSPEWRMLDRTHAGLRAELGSAALEQALAEGASLELTALLERLAAVFDAG